MAHIALDSCEIPPAGPSKRGKSRTRCLQQLQVSRERSHCWYSRLLKCFQSLSCARHHRIYSELVSSFLLKLTRNPPMGYVRVNKLNKLTILFTFSETGSFCSCFNLFSLITQNCGGGWTPVCWGRLPVTYFTSLLSTRVSLSAKCLMNQRLSSITEITEPVQIPLAFLKESAEGAKRRGKSSNQNLFVGWERAHLEDGI